MHVLNRLTEIRYDETQPEYSNDNEAFRQEKPGVEFGIIAHEEMKKKVKGGSLSGRVVND